MYAQHRVPCCMTPKDTADMEREEAQLPDTFSRPKKVLQSKRERTVVFGEYDATHTRQCR